ncbi:hypothetical protein PS896_02045 [Pseudomonas fluorescens]|uniref:Uncharacterized protein n=2 Tax=Pseudomonas fluorescens TaxID=294 RepID=A0A5E7J8C0_PSEFL|nr:hypothetical protein PS896_02045 [Pseudomonas fluorescens]
MSGWAVFFTFFIPVTTYAAQQVYSNNVFLLNTCGVPLELSVVHDSNYDDKARRLVLSPNQRRTIANYRSFGEDVAGQISDQYSLSIKSPTATKTIDAQTLRKAVASTERTEQKAVRSWVITDGSFCP